MLVRVVELFELELEGLGYLVVVDKSDLRVGDSAPVGVSEQRGLDQRMVEVVGLIPNRGF